jgi:hypothetical protein
MHFVPFQFDLDELFVYLMFIKNNDEYFAKYLEKNIYLYTPNLPLEHFVFAAPLHLWRKWNKKE